VYHSRPVGDLRACANHLLFGAKLVHGVAGTNSMAVAEPWLAIS
jgi:hypothetical protein